MTKELRTEQAKQVKASHFQLGYPREEDASARMGMEAEALKQKWQPKTTLAKVDNSSSNFKLGSKNGFDGISIQMNDFPVHKVGFDPLQKAKRQELAHELRKSSLPRQHFEFPISTAKESFADSNSKADALKERRKVAEEVYTRTRGAKPNITFGGDKLDYLSENKGSLKQPQVYVYDKNAVNEQAVRQRKHNFKMSYEQGSQFETDRNAKNPLTIQADDKNYKPEQVATKGSSNAHNV